VQALPGNPYDGHNADVRPDDAEILQAGVDARTPMKELAHGKPLR
jgi:hypothetical protein